ncbi:Hypothetical_protein [Hexamita inflata]|uniref:Hypothetical_protein n=1 Tax=Hexamita inflata TaxID=28002 RepID=A0ABP1JU37_9EUKA
MQNMELVPYVSIIKRLDQILVQKINFDQLPDILLDIQQYSNDITNQLQHYCYNMNTLLEVGINDCKLNQQKQVKVQQQFLSEVQHIIQQKPREYQIKQTTFEQNCNKVLELAALIKNNKYQNENDLKQMKQQQIDWQQSNQNMKTELLSNKKQINELQIQLQYLSIQLYDLQSSFQNIKETNKQNLAQIQSQAHINAENAAETFINVSKQREQLYQQVQDVKNENMKLRANFEQWSNMLKALRRQNYNNYSQMLSNHSQQVITMQSQPKPIQQTQQTICLDFTSALEAAYLQLTKENDYLDHVISEKEQTDYTMRQIILDLEQTVNDKQQQVLRATAMIPKELETIKQLQNTVKHQEDQITYLTQKLQPKAISVQTTKRMQSANISGYQKLVLTDEQKMQLAIRPMSGFK